jgi:hypothetical protein
MKSCTNSIVRDSILRIVRNNLFPILVLWLIGHIPLHAQVKGDEKFSLKLKTREFIPQKGIQSMKLLNLQHQIVTERHYPHVMIQFKEIPTAYERELLSESGIRLFNYIGNNSWYGSITDTTSLHFQEKEALKKYPTLNLVRSIEEISAEDKISSQIAEKGIGDWARTQDGKVNLVVSYFEDVDLNVIKERLQIIGAIILGEVSIVHNITIAIKEEKISDIAAEDFIEWLEPIPPIGKPETDKIRAHLQVNLVQTSPCNLTGDGVIVGVFDNSHAYINHPDLVTRSYQGDTDPTNYFSHPTNMAGIIAGTGSQSSSHGGTTNQWKGMATEAEIYTYDYEPGTATGTPANNNLNYCGDLQTAIGTHHIDIANNSWGTFGCYDFSYGNYNGLCPTLDATVRGAFGKPVTIVFSAGNERDGYNDGTNVENTSCIINKNAPYANYFTMNHPKAAKNIITVGAIDSYNNRMSKFSSWGPINDGRLKPDIVASGLHNGTLNSGITDVTSPAQVYLAPFYPITGPNSGMYGYTYMTSASAAATSGCLALLLEDYRKKMSTEIDPLPSTMKALLIQSAQDLDDNTVTWYNPGPDYASGYGLLQIKDAVDLVESISFREGKVNSGRSDHYTFDVPTGATEVKVTLAWDDPPAAINAVSALVNDLDLIVYNPGDAIRYFPWTLDPANPSNPAVRNAADHINNVEQVFVDQGIVSGTWRVVVDPYLLPEPPQRYSLVANYQLDGEIDVIQVLDRSGSMGGMATTGMADTKIEKLRDASSEFINIMKPNIGNRLGIVLFNQNVVPFAPGDQAELSVLDGARAAHLLTNTITAAKIYEGGTTSIGDGLREAVNQFINAPTEPMHNRSILLVTDGMENTPEWIATVKPDLIANDITVHVLGLGYGSGINESKLVDLVEATGGTYRITSDHLIFQKLFIETLAGAVDWSDILDPIGTISSGEVKLIPVTVQPDQDMVTFTVFWEGIDNAIDCQLITPSGKVISKDTKYSVIRYGEHESYIFYQLDFPLIAELANEWKGEWKMKLSGADIIGDKRQVRFSTSAFAESGPKLNVELSKLKNLTGEELFLKADLKRGGKAITGATIKVFGDVPLVGAGNVLHEGKVNWDQLQQTVVFNGDTLSLIERKLRILSNAMKKEILPRDTTSFILYDDGLHGDGSANDGTYANKFVDTKTQGSYTFRFLAYRIPAGGRNTSTCEWTKSFFNEVNIDPEYSDIRLQKLNISPDGVTHNLNVTLKDKYGNYMGPGHDVSAKINFQGNNRYIKLTDNIDGTYFKKITLSGKEFNSGAGIEIYVDGNKFTEVQTLKRWSLSLHAGSSIPSGNFANDYQTGINVLLDVDYHFSNQWTLVSLFGYNNFKSKTTGVDDQYLFIISANLRYYKPFSASWSVYIGGGPGLYIPKNGNTEFGANIGLGINYELNSRVNFEIGADYHAMFSNNTQFIQNHIGVVFRF